MFQEAGLAAVRVSLGIVSNMADVIAFLRFAERLQNVHSVGHDGS